MSQKSTAPHTSQSGASIAEILFGIAVLCAFFAIIIYFTSNVRENNKVDRTFTAIYALKEEVKKVNRSSSSYPKDSLIPLMFTSNALPDKLIIDHERQIVSTAMGHPLDITGRGTHFSIDIYSLNQNECMTFGDQILQGRYIALGNVNDDFDFFKIGDRVFSDEKPLTADALKEACTRRFSIDVNMAFR